MKTVSPNIMEEKLIQKAAMMGVPIKATLELTPQCNLNCKMCYIKHSALETQKAGGVLPLRRWLQLIPEMKELGVLFVALIGGEPFLYPGIDRLYQELYKQGFYCNITTNGTLLADGIPDWLAQYPPRYMTVSLYGASNDTYQRVTGDANGFTKTIRGLEHLLAAEIPTQLSLVLTKENQEDLAEIFRIKEHYHLPIVTSAYCFPKVRVSTDSKREDNQRLSPIECGRKELELLRLKQGEGEYQKKLEYLAKENFRQNTERHTTQIYCHAGKSTFWITWQGDIVPCGMIKSISKKNHPGELVKDWEWLKKEAARKRISKKCAGCEKREICKVCPASMEAESGDMEQTPEYFCQMTQEMICCSRKNSLHKTT